MDYKLASAGAKWWIKQMKKRCDVVDISLSEKLSRFEKMLTDEIQNNLNLYHYINFGCCYYPSKILKKIAENAGISTDLFPIHAHMEIVNDTILVSIDKQEPYKLNISIM